MNDYNVKRMILAMAIQAKIDGMKAYNLAHPDNLGYGEEQFNSYADELETLAYKHDQQL